ncbi:nucleoside recognition domain-containing protein [Paenibacillus macerans]|uniref:nucleoside recognition domain-containing protein n=1 Tax=Paenibacillus macerans TaxID=44252 RepID=UPI002040DEC9|nr:nucleoside recognition domain-containing protein [Paenibacillus macerans]MCM3701639.1 50S ribosome-binding GTPase [Paenibacillus macerans]
MLKRDQFGPRSVVMIGFESSGKSALFRGLTGQNTGEEANFRGSTVMVRRGSLTDAMELADLPGIRVKDDSVVARMAMDAVTDADILLLVVRATHAAKELPLLLDAVKPDGKHAVLVLTFADKIRAGLPELTRECSDWLGIPVFAVDARWIMPADKKELLRVLDEAGPIRPGAGASLALPFRAVQPQITWFEHPIWGRPLSFAMTLLLFAAPVLVAYLLSAWLQPITDRRVIDPVKSLFADTPLLLHSFLVGDYGLLTLGWYSFLWAFPVVLLLGLSVALVEESGIKDRITDSLDGPMRVIGLSGRDLIPVLSGFGCNVVAVFQSRACSACTRKSCVSLIAFGSACSYQIGASLSVFSSAGHPWLFLPYISVLGLAGALHTRVWNGKPAPLAERGYESKTYLQKPGIRAVSWRIRTVIKQFLFQSMPIFIAICLTAAALQLTGLMTWLTAIVQPVLRLFHLPPDAASGIVFSMVRKDGLLILNQGEGELLTSMNAAQVFLLVYLASTLTACLVTLWTVRKEMGWSFAASMAGKQAATSLVTSGIILLIFGR